MTTATQLETLQLADGREIEYYAIGDSAAPALLFQCGTPMAAAAYEPLTRAARERGLRLIGCSRPGYGASTAQPGRNVAAVAADVAQLMDHLGHEQFLTAGISGGGPHALATAALLPGRCLAAASVGGIAPYDAEGLDFLAGMGESNVEEFGLALRGREALEEFYAPQLQQFQQLTGAALGNAFGSLISKADSAALTDEISDYLALTMRRALERGPDGWIDDDLAMTVPWGFDVRDITVPTVIWHGAQDLFVPPAHARWLAERIPGAIARIHADEGHLSLIARRLPAVIDDLLELPASTPHRQ
jgi:pimeloyl-ACP methyl ester carboxylesterase